jgi:large subunit ribosomal protein L6
MGEILSRLKADGTPYGVARSRGMSYRDIPKELRAMSRIGKRPIEVPKGVKIEIEAENLVKVTGPKGTLQRQLSPEMQILQNDSIITVSRPSESPSHKAMHGLTRTLLSNMVQGVTIGFTKGLEISGTGYRVAKVGNNLIFLVGYSHPVEFQPPQGISFAVDGTTKCSVTGIDKELVGQVAAQMRAIRKPEPYKGKGIKYAGEIIRRKAGKAGKVGGKKK